MCNEICNNRKTAPIHPEQLTTERLLCAQCEKGGANGGDKNICKCSFCGIGTDDFVRGALLETYIKHPDYPIVLIENVHCPGIEDSKTYESASRALQERQDSVRFVPYEDGNFKDYYLEKKDDGTVKIYHVYDLSPHYERSCNGNYSKEKQSDGELKKERIQSELGIAADIMSGKARKGNINTSAYAYTCTGSDRSLIELAVPIEIDGLCVAVMIICQLDPNQMGGFGKGEDGMCELNRDEIGLDESVKDMMRSVDDFSKRMKERVKLRKSDYFYRLLTRLYNILSKNESSVENVNEIIDQIYQEIDDVFDYRELMVFYSDTEQDSGFSTVQFPRGSKKNDSFDSKALLDAVYEDNDQALRNLFGVSTDKNVGFYRQHSRTAKDNESLTCFILTYVRWQREENTSVNNFFDSLNARLFSLLMTKLALEKQREANTQKRSQEILIQTFSHDLNQKLEIVENHTRLLEIKKGSWGLRSDSRALDDVRNYVKDIQNLEMQLRHFTMEVRENHSGFPERKAARDFFPYGVFLFNLQEYYNSLDIVRKLYMPTAGGVAINVANYPLMRADPVLIERCVNNLLTNAFKYSYRYSNIYLDCYKKDDNYIIEVTNFTSPIREDIIDRMFEPGISQSILRNYRQEKGKGYGLAIVKQICDLHDGDVDCDSDEIISSYNVPVLARLMNELSAAEEAGTLPKKLEKYKVALDQYKEIKAEYKRLEAQSSDRGKNYVASLFGRRNSISEICNPSAKYSEYLTAPYLRMALRTPTVRVRFIITLPQ